MSLSQATAVQRVRLYLGDFPWETTGLAPTSTSDVSVEDGGEWAKGDLGEFDDGDLFRVKAAPEGYTLPASRSYLGSTGAAHADGSRIVKNPTFKFVEITNAISSVIQQLPYPRAYKVIADSITPDPDSTVWYDLAADALDLVRVGQRSGSDDIEWEQYGLRHAAHRVRLQTSLPAGLAASGVALSFPDGFFHPTNTVYVDYAARITATVSSDEYEDLDDGSALTVAVLFETAAVLADAMEFRKPPRPTPDTGYLNPGALFHRRADRALAHHERDLRASDPLMT